MATISAGTVLAGITAATAVVGTVANVAGSVVQGKAITKQGQDELKAALYEADQLDRAAGEELAAGQRDALEIGRQTGMVLGTLRANAGAQGAGGPGVAALMADLRNQGSYRAGLSLYGAIERAKGDTAEAVARRTAGRAALSGSRGAAAGTILSGIGSAAYNATTFFAQFGKNAYPDVVTTTTPTYPWATA